MSHELLYTSAARGLKPGSRGFCTVASSQGIPAPLASVLESLSSYRHVYRPGDPRAGDNPIVWSHVRLSAGGRQYNVLSRISDYDLDYSDRSNKLAHHVALESREQTAGGPAWSLGQPGFMETSWDGTPRVIPTGRPALRNSHDLDVCTAWQTLTGDAGWAGVLAESFLANPDRHACIVFALGMDLLPLMIEAVSLLPPERCWEATFSTYYTGLPPGVVCNWRCVLADSPEDMQSRRSVQALRINLCEPLPTVVGGALVDIARTGRIAIHASLATELPPEGAHQQLSVDDSPEEQERETLAEGASSSEPGATGIEIVPMPPGETYGVDVRSALAPGMPPPPPPSAGRQRRRLEALQAEDTRRRRQWMTGVAVALALMFAGVGFGMWMRSGTGTAGPKVVAVADDSDGGDSDTTDTDSAADVDGPDKRTDAAAKTADVHDTASAARREKVGSTGGEKAKNDGASDVPHTKSRDENESSASATRIDSDERSDETPLPPPPASDEPAPNFDGRTLVPDRSSATAKLYYFDAVAGKTLDVPVSGENVSWDLHIPNGFSGFDVDRADSAMKVLSKKGTVGRDQDRVFTLTGDLQPKNLLLTFTGGNTDPTAIKWCVISVNDAGAPLLFALQNGQLRCDEAQFKGGTCKNLFQQDADNSKVPLLQAESIVVRLGDLDRTFGFELPSATQKPHVNAPLRSPQLEDYARESLQVPAVVSIEMKQEPTGMTLAIKGLLTLENTLKKRLDSQVKDLNRQPGADLPKIKATRIENEWKQGSTEHLTELEAAIVKKINDLAGTTQGALNIPPAVTALKAAEAKIAGLRKTVEQFFVFKKSLQGADITEAHFYYEVVTPGRKQPTKIRLRFTKSGD